MRRVTVAKLALIGITLLAAYLRLSNLELTEFKLDEANVCSRAAEFLASGRPPLVGIGSSVGAANPPLFVYLMAIPISLSRNPAVIAGFIALLNVGAVLGCYLLTRRYFGEKVGLIAALLFAVSPWAVFYSCKIWAQDLLPPFVVLFFAAVFSTLVKRKPRQLILVFLWLACLVQLHLSALALIPLVVLLLLVFKARISLIPLLVGLLVFALIFAPYIYYDATQGWTNLRTFIEVSTGPGAFDLKSAQYAAEIIAGQGYHALAGASFRGFLAEITGFTWLDAVETWLFSGGVAYLAWRVLTGWRRGRKEGVSDETVNFTILLSWLLLPVLFYVRHTTPVYPHYFILLYPVQFIIIGVFAVNVLNWAVSVASSLKTSPLVCFLTGRVLPVSIVALILLGLALWQVHLTETFYNFVDRNDTTGGHGLPVKYYLQATETLRRLSSASGNEQVLILSEGDVPAWHETPAIFDFLLRPSLDPRYIDYQQAIVFPEADALYFLAPGDTLAVSVLDEYAQELTRERIGLRGGPDAFRFYHLDTESLTSIKASLAGWDMPVALDNGVEILGYDVSGEVTPGGVLHLALHWTVKAVPDASYHFFNHLIDDEGQRWGQQDGAGYPAGQWRERDIVVSWFDISISPDTPLGDYWILTGMYTYPEGVRASVLDEWGQPVSDALQRGPIEVGPGSLPFHRDDV